MPVQYEKSGGQGHVFSVPDYPEAADGPKAFKDFADFLDLILPPVGTIMPYVGNTAPTGWLPCTGGEYSSTTYPKLSALCGTKFGTASAGNFRVPDLKGRVMAGLDTSQSEFDTIGKTGGAKTVTLTTSNMPVHNHSATGISLSGLVAQNGGTPTTGGDHGHTFSGTTPSGQGTHGHTGGSLTQFVTNVTATTNVNTSGGGSLDRVSSISVSKDEVDVFIGTALDQGGHTHTYSGTTVSAGGHTHTISGTISGNVANAGSGTSFSVQNPYITMNHIIRAA